MLTHLDLKGWLVEQEVGANSTVGPVGVLGFMVRFVFSCCLAADSC